jgi:hypothetical protein
MQGALLRFSRFTQPKHRKTKAPPKLLPSQ